MTTKTAKVDRNHLFWNQALPVHQCAKRETGRYTLNIFGFKIQYQTVGCMFLLAMGSIVLPQSALACGQKLTLKKVACYVFEGDLECNNISVADEKQCVINIVKSKPIIGTPFSININLKNVTQELIRAQKFPQNSTPIFRISGPQILRKASPDGKIETSDNYSFALKGEPETTMLGLEHIFRYFCST